MTTTEDSDQGGTEIIRVLTRVVAPVGTGIWAFTQAATTSSTPAMVVLLLLVVVSLFIGFNQSIEIADERLNRRYNEALGYNDV